MASFGVKAKVICLAPMATRAAAVLMRRLEEQRARLGLTQAAFARLIGVPAPNYTKFKRGDLPLNPMLETLEQWAERLRVPLWYLVSDDEPKLSPEKQAAIEAGERFLSLADNLRTRSRR